jgi:hypothetical protein
MRERERKKETRKLEKETDRKRQRGILLFVPDLFLPTVPSQVIFEAKRKPK